MIRPQPISWWTRYPIYYKAFPVLLFDNREKRKLKKAEKQSLKSFLLTYNLRFIENL